MVALARFPEELVLQGAAPTTSRSAEAINGWALFVTGAWPLMVKAISLLAQAQARRRRSETISGVTATKLSVRRKYLRVRPETTLTIA